MKIELREITLAELAAGYEDSAEGGVFGYGGKLDIRPPYQREFIYKDRQRDAVIDTINRNFPLNVMYWAVRDDGNFEVIDGQQRTISACQYIEGDFSVNNLYFQNLTDDQQKKILDYRLMIYLCSGTDSEKLEWLKTINIAGEKLTDQELRNAVYSGPWVTDAKRHFSKNGCPAYNLGADYLEGRVDRQDYLETVISWKSGGKIEDYMARHQHEPSAHKLWVYFQSVIGWAKAVFPTYRKEMKGVDWGPLHDRFKDDSLDPKALEEEVKALMQDDDVTKKTGIYPYVLTREERHLNIRAFSTSQRREAFERQGGVCPICRETFSIEDMEADHITPWHDGGKTNAENCQMLCRKDNREKAGK